MMAGFHAFSSFRIDTGAVEGRGGAGSGQQAPRRERAQEGQLTADGSGWVDVGVEKGRGELALWRLGGVVCMVTKRV